jgi:hypothetical protein
MEQKYKKYCIYAICIILLILVGHLVYNYVINSNSNNSNNSNNIENFVVDPSSLDLLKKQQSNKVSNKLSTSNPDGSTISKWSNKFYNLQTLSQVKPLSFWKPQIPISNGKEMLKLGDMVSQDPVYAPPTEKSLFVAGDAQPPSDYATILEFKGINFDGFYNELDMYVNNLNDLNNIFSSLKLTIQAVTSLNSLLQTGMPNIVSALNQVIINKIMAGVGTNTMSLNVLSSISESTTAIQQVNSSSDVITLPAGVTITLMRMNTDKQPIPGTSPIPLSFDININSDLKNDKLNMLNMLNILSARSYFGNLTQEQITFETSTVNVSSVPSIFGVVKDMIRNIRREIAIFKNKNPELATYLDLDAIAPNIQNYINTSLNYSYSYPVIRIPISELTNLGFNVNNTTLGYKINMFNALDIPKLLNNMYFFNDITQLPNYENSQLAKFINNITLLTNLGNQISSGTLDMFSFKIFAPIPPPNYVALGHVFANITDKADTIKANNKVGCVLKNCVKEVRNWRATDMIYEYSKESVYFNIFYNPYVGTFIVNDRRGMPDGKVCKVIACVKQCTVVDDIIKADKCARNFQNINKSLSSDKPLTLSLSTDEEDSYYLEKIAKQSQHIALLQGKAHKMQIDTDKADIINKEYNKSKLQNLVDTQQRNIDLVMKRLENDKNKIDVDVTIPLEVINNITSLINDSPNIPNEVKKTMIDKIINNKTMADSNIITGEQYRANISKILKSCQDYDLNGFVRKDMAAQVCYGCDDPK